MFETIGLEGGESNWRRRPTAVREAYAAVTARFKSKGDYGYRHSTCLHPEGTESELLRAGDGIRTHDNNVGNVVLYQLSYTRLPCDVNAYGTSGYPASSGSLTSLPESSDFSAPRLRKMKGSTNYRSATGPCKGTLAPELPYFTPFPWALQTLPAVPVYWHSQAGLSFS